jgi:signal peptidase II
MNNSHNKISVQNIAIASVMAIFFIADRYLKILALSLSQVQSWKLVGDIFTFNCTPNYYMAFSLPLGGQILNAAVLTISAALLACILYLIKRQPDKKIEIILLITILCGAFSNILDRLTYGYVIDYLALKYFTVFNLADVMISGGALILIWWSLKNK